MQQKACERYIFPWFHMDKILNAPFSESNRKNGSFQNFKIEKEPKMNFSDFEAFQKY